MTKKIWIYKRKCIVCGKRYETFNKKQKYCDLNCAVERIRKVNNQLRIRKGYWYQKWKKGVKNYDKQKASDKYIKGLRKAALRYKEGVKISSDRLK